MYAAFELLEAKPAKGAQAAHLPVNNGARKTTCPLSHFHREKLPLTKAPMAYKTAVASSLKILPPPDMTRITRYGSRYNTRIIASAVSSLIAHHYPRATFES